MILRIRDEQFKIFEAAALRNFEEEMVAHSKEYAPRLCNVLGEEQLRMALRRAMQRADGYGFTNRGSIRLYIEMIFLFGSDFDTDPQYPAIGKILRTDDEQMQRAEQLFEITINYQDQGLDFDASRAHKALEALPELVERLNTNSGSNTAAEMCKEISRLYPLKAGYVGNEGLTTLIHEAFTQAREYGFTAVRDQALLVVLKLVFGHGCAKDPLYPWISQALNDSRFSAARVKQLEKNTQIWFSHMLTKPQEKVPV